MTTLSIVIPTLNEEHSLPRTLSHLRALDPAPDEIVIADGGSSDDTITIAAEMGGAMADEAGAQSASQTAPQTASQTASQTMGQIPIRILTCPQPGRGPQINAGVGAAMGDIVCILHADSELPRDAIALMRAAMRDDRLALSSFLPRLVGEGGTRWGSSLHNVAKVWYAPLIGRPLAFARAGPFVFAGGHGFRRDPCGVICALSDYGRCRFVPQICAVGPGAPLVAMGPDIGSPDCPIGQRAGQYHLS